MKSKVFNVLFLSFFLFSNVFSAEGDENIDSYSSRFGSDVFNVAKDLVYNIENWIMYQVEFAIAGLKDKKTVGTIFQCSRWVGRSLAKNIPHHEIRDYGVNVLEAGAGAGGITKQILEKLGDGDHLDIVEIDSGLCETLRKRFDDDTRVTIHEKSIVDVKSDQKYDFILSTLPLNAFELDDVEGILDYFVKNINDNGFISYVEYPLTWIMKKYLSSEKTKQNYLSVQEKTINLRGSLLTETNRVVINMPPFISVYHMQALKEN